MWKAKYMRFTIEDILKIIYNFGKGSGRGQQELDHILSATNNERGR